MQPGVPEMNFQTRSAATPDLVREARRLVGEYFMTERN